LAVGWVAFRAYHTLNPSWPRLTAAQESQDFQDILKLHALSEVKDRFLALGEQLQADMAELREALEEFLRDKNRADIERYVSQSQALDTWLRKQRAAADRRRQQMLRDWLETLPGTNAVSQVLNLDALLDDIDQAYSNYLASVRLSDTQPLTPELVQR